MDGLCRSHPVDQHMCCGDSRRVVKAGGIQWYVSVGERDELLLIMLAGVKVCQLSSANLMKSDEWYLPKTPGYVKCK
jgi:hypothetical protein